MTDLDSGVTSMIARGITGAHVRDLQTALNGITEAGLKVDGIFGPKTEEAVRTFQTTFKLKADGIVGKNTGNCLVAVALCRNQAQIRAKVRSTARSR
jgi:peptidoglycan hydrolase-like protein with peptidoglycan-binding domain